MFTRQGRSLRAAAVVVVIGCLAAACGSSSSSTAASTSHRSLTPVSYITDFVASGFYVPILYAQKLGYFKDQGISLSITYGTGSVTTGEQVSEGKFDIGDAGAATVPAVDAKGGDIESVGTFIGKPTYGFWVPKNSGITKISQLSGKSVLVSPGDFGSLMLPGVLAAAGLNVSDVTKVSVPGSDKLAAYAGGQGFAYEGSLPYSAPAILKARPSTPIPFASVGFPGPDTVFIARPGENPKLIKEFLTAVFEGINASLKHPSAAVAAFMATSPPVTESVASGQFHQFFFDYLCGSGQAGHPDGYQVPSSWSKLTSLLKKYEGIPVKAATSYYTNKDLPSASTVPLFCK